MQLNNLSLICVNKIKAMSYRIEEQSLKYSHLNRRLINGNTPNVGEKIRIDDTWFEVINIVHEIALSNNSNSESEAIVIISRLPVESHTTDRTNEITDRTNENICTNFPQESSNHLKIIKEAYDRCGIKYVVREDKSTFDDCVYHYLFLIEESEVSLEYFKSENLDKLLALEHYMEFENGKIVSC